MIARMCNRALPGMICMSLALMLSACNTTKATIDSTIKFFSSTTPESMFTIDGLVEPKQKVNLFSGVAYENLRQDIARGEGEYLTSLGMLLGIPPGSQQEFGSFVQSRHSTLFTTDLIADHTAHLKMLAALNREWEANQHNGNRAQ
jgi:hypothetical protein